MVSPHGQALWNHLSQEIDLCHEPPRTNIGEGERWRKHGGGVGRGALKKHLRLRLSWSILDSGKTLVSTPRRKYPGRKGAPSMAVLLHWKSMTDNAGG